ncbi:aminotransferase class III-fold pyridoxal phosphate-dependent enzyme [Actinoplanes flavus]|uniref:Aminotransferase class III-fold pyridoxal phosphate-dependent enzyme n=1 Tax=Actinoplanes flavus TaxID=2820290 RepID=A0ABS3UCX8_9ACTN|nr:aminotransferase class III-fold pyridoxal phosphate-dependent enzyme [Actinoplanes flavus]MBO3736639.1 aminotransferase class III-fold pyridoxal phosphate-dependent enzyme [Actinoplanes flavus]
MDSFDTRLPDVGDMPMGGRVDTIAPLRISPRRVPPTGMSAGMTLDDQWHARSVRTDARAATRGDILPPGLVDETRYPRYFSRAAGPYLWDLAGTRYVDFNLGYGPVVLGHADDRVIEAVTAELRNGNCIAPLWSCRQGELTELLVSLVPGAELAYLLKTGSDATSCAVRLCRIFTGREKVLRWGYNGWHDWAAGIPAGVPAATRADTLLFDYHDLSTLRDAFAQHRGQVACVLMMPFGDEAVPEGHLQEVRRIAHEHGALFVLDEMRSGFRLALAGVQGLLGVQADVSTFSKAMANGHPISAVVGRGDVLSCLGRTRISSTFYADPAPMAAALATIAILRDTDALQRLWKAGTAFQQSLSALVDRHGVPARVVGYPPMPFLRFTDPDPVRCQRLSAAFAAAAASGGVLLHPNHQWFVSAAHTREDIEFAVHACDQALASLAPALATQAT